jgi:hypothetical protein
LPVNVRSWNERFAEQVASIGLTEAEAERVLLRAPITDVDTRLRSLLAEIAESDPERHARIAQLIRLKSEQMARLQS